MPKINAPYLLLDTHVWVWLMNGDQRLNRKNYLEIIEECASRNTICVSAISVWELGMLVAKGRLMLSKNIHQWIQESLSSRGISLEPLSMDILLESTLMGDDAYGDPADRMIITTAKHMKAMIMTADEKMISYCHHHHLSTSPIS